MEFEEPKTNPEHPRSKESGISLHSRDKRKKPLGIKIKFTQIQKKTPQSESNSKLVPYESPSESRSKRKRGSDALPERNARKVMYDNSTYSRSGKRKRKAATRQSTSTSETKTSALVRAEEFRETLGTECPSFSKSLVRSNVTVGFWMHLPMRFCKLYMPDKDATVFVEDETGVEYILNYIAERTALSGGWKKFCGSHKLAEGDVLIFHLIKALRFKVYIVKEKESAQLHGNRRIPSEPVSNGVQAKPDIITSEKKPVQSDLFSEKLEDETTAENEASDSLCGLMLQDGGQVSMDQSIAGDVGQVPDPLQRIKDPEKGTDFRANNSLDRFSIIVNDLAIDSELTEEYRAKYHELCCSQSSYLHYNLLQSINNKLAAEIIIETVKISESIRASKVLNSREEYAVWDKTLKGFELLGMNVAFLRARLSRLMNLATETDEVIQLESSTIKTEQAHLNEKICSLQWKLDQLKEARECLDIEIDSLKENAEKAERAFQELIDSPW